MNSKNINILNNSIMDCKIFNENIDWNRADYIMNMEDNHIKRVFWSDREFSDNNKCTFKTYLGRLRKWLYDCMVGQKEMECDYGYASNKSMGRLYNIKFGLQSLQTNLRNFLCNNLYTDIDIKNAHFSILYGILVREYPNMSCKYLKRYVLNRDRSIKKHNFTKKDALIMLNSDKLVQNKKDNGFYTHNPFLIKMFYEISKIKNKWFADPKYIKFKSDNIKNPKSSFLNHIICFHESQLLQKAIHHFKLQDDICVPMFDGLLIKKVDETIQDLFIDQINNCTKQEGHGVEWAIKEINFNIGLTDAEIINKRTKSNLYIDKKEEYEKSRCFICSTGEFQFNYKDGDGNNTWISYPDSKLKIESKNKACIGVDGKPSNMYDQWITDPTRSEYQCFGFYPYNPKLENTIAKHVFNTFSGFPWNMALIDIEDIKDDTLYTFLNDVIATQDYKTYEYIYMKLAHIIQFPNENPHVCTILTGDQGTGKDSLLYLISKLIGTQYVVSTNRLEDVIPKRGEFNMKLKDKIVCNMNEIIGKDGTEFIEQIKEFVTREENSIRELYKAPYAQKNIIRLFILSNNINPIQMTDGQRRFIWIKINSKYKGNVDYWETLYSHMNNKNWIEQIGNELLNVKGVQEYFKNKDYPETAVMKQYYNFNRPIYTDFVYNGIIKKECINKRDTIKDGILYLPIYTVYDRFKQYSADNASVLKENWSKLHCKKMLCALKGVSEPIPIKVNKNQKKTTIRMFRFNIDVLTKTLEPLYVKEIENTEVITLTVSDDFFLDDDDDGMY